MSIVTPLKRCTKCGVEFPPTLEYFPPSNATLSGLHSWCRTCKRADNRNYMRRVSVTPEFKARKREYEKTPKARVRARRYYKEHYSTPEYLEERRIKNATPEHKEKRRAYYTREDVKAHERIQDKEYGKTYRQSAKYKETRKQINERRKSDPHYREVSRTAYQRRQARKRNLPNTLTVEQWDSCLNYFANSCAVCGRPRGLWHTLACDHWIPLTANDCPGTVATNCVPLCHGDGGCNNSKNNNSPIEWLECKFGKRKAREILARIEAYFKWVNTPE